MTEAARELRYWRESDPPETRALRRVLCALDARQDGLDKALRMLSGEGGRKPTWGGNGQEKIDGHILIWLRGASLTHVIERIEAVLSGEEFDPPERSNGPVTDA